MPENPFSPISLNERETFMDALRGFAILGIFIANLSGLSFYSSDRLLPGGWYFTDFDKQMLFAQHILIEGKFYSIFSLLFGWGLALQIKRMQTSDNPSASKNIIKRRLIFMLILGLIHLVLIWSGDIVAFYALVGFILLLFIKLSPKKLVIVGTISIFLPIFFYWLKTQNPLFNKPSELFFSIGQNLDSRFLKAATQEDFIKLIMEGSIRDLLIYNFNGFFYRFGDLIFQSRFFKVLGIFFLGYAFGISGYYKILLNRPKLLLLIFVMGLTIGLPANYIMAEFMKTPDNYRQFKIEGLYQTIAYAIGVAPLALSYVALLALLFKNKVGNRVMMLFSPVGRMAFTNYISHSLISIITFYGVGFGLMGMLGPTSWTLFAIAVFSLQIVFSTIWLNYFQYGPLEWVWRSMTYGKLQSMRINKVV